jgi:thiosulfate reductase cytochrome b subunit
LEKANDRLLVKLNRVLVWLTLFLFIVFIISGYGITNPEVIRELTGGVFTRAVSLNLHLNLAFPVLVLLTIHILIGAKSALTRWGVKQGKLLNSFLILLGVFAVALLTLMQYFVS